jgi:hypothetical protein
MSSNAQTFERESVFPDLIYCIGQPGNLRLSKLACARRYRLAQKIHPHLSDDEFEIARTAGLQICRRCPLGESMARRFNGDSRGRH